MGSPQTQIAMRVRSERVADVIREKMNSVDGIKVEAEESSGDSFGLVSQRMRIIVDETSYPARLVNLPTLVETHKTFDGSTYFKCGDVSQMVLVYESEDERAEDEKRKGEGAAWRTLYPDGLSPPLRDVVTRRFSKARPAAKVAYSHAEVEAVENQMVEIVSNQGKLPTEELLCEDVVPFQDWMVDQNAGETMRTFRDDAPIAAKHPWILLDKVGAYNDFVSSSSS